MSEGIVKFEEYVLISKGMMFLTHTLKKKISFLNCYN